MSKFLSSMDWSEVQGEGLAVDNFRKFNAFNGLEQCPWCGQDFHEHSDAVIEEGGERFEDYYDSDPEKKHYHPDCWRKKTLSEDKEIQPKLSEII